MDCRHAPALKPAVSRRRHLWIAAIVVLALLAGYAGTLAWVTRRLEGDVQKTIRPLAADRADSQ